ncbi:hypothetical protein G8C41_03845 [Apibacter sp. B3706]|uniref:hypothetical protein n=1 Tax=unclassified Apibacter TaxID=2630820 RepID=UPI000CFA67F8|nr:MULTISPECIES: hypothetical protein [unclassified Apibacter]MCX8676270.1 hypothetical protein [Apibacter sp. B3919]MXO23737.1 hypothetical protein [Apibacter sp. B3924]MXO26585.1 hypothetical protein [Apibacter sp. B3813]MXO29452.1 hypothetical protein [Apibacter sp. B3913]MXO31404.1 hypothetical protein [Apibacter sp. B3912]
MVMQYPYKLEILVIAESIRDGNGDYQPQKTEWKHYCYCRDEAGNGKVIKGVDGVNYLYTALIQCPKGTKQVTQGTLIRVIDGEGSVRVQELPVMYSRMDQLHTRLWV